MARPGISAAIDICFLRTLNTPWIWPTCVLSVSTTLRLGESLVSTTRVAPLRALIRPWILTVSAAAIVLPNRRTAPSEKANVPSRDRYRGIEISPPRKIRYEDDARGRSSGVLFHRGTAVVARLRRPAATLQIVSWDVCRFGRRPLPYRGKIHRSNCHPPPLPAIVSWFRCIPAGTDQRT